MGCNYFPNASLLYEQRNDERLVLVVFERDLCYPIAGLVQKSICWYE